MVDKDDQLGGSDKDHPIDYGRWSDWAMEEYKAARAESAASMQVQQQVAAFGVTLLAAVATLSPTIQARSSVALAALAVMSPLIAFAVVAAYVGEIERFVRAGAFTARLENRLARHFAERPLEWESYMRESRDSGSTAQALVRYRGTSAALAALSLTPALLQTTAKHELAWVRALIVVLAVLYLLGTAAFYHRHETQAKQLLTDAATDERGG